MNERARVPFCRHLSLVLACGACALASAGACSSERDFQQPNGGSTSGGNAGKGGGSGQSGTTHSAGTSGTGTTGAGRGGAGGSNAGGGARSQAGESLSGEGGSGGDTATAGDAGYGGVGGSAAGGSSALAGAGGETESGGSSNGGTSGSGAGPSVCGNGEVEDDEACDDGEGNGLDLLACAPDCSRIIQAKHIVLSETVDDGRLSPNPVAAADARCPVGYKALFSYGTSRRATTTPFETRNSIDWVLKPYTYYLNENENLIWMTNEVALLGIEDGAFVGLDNPPGFSTYAIASNMKIDGTTLTSENCQGWDSTQDSDEKRWGVPLVTDEGYLYNSYLLDCGHQIAFYCVEQ